MNAELFLVIINLILISTSAVGATAYHYHGLDTNGNSSLTEF